CRYILYDRSTIFSCQSYVELRKTKTSQPCQDSSEKDIKRGRHPQHIGRQSINQAPQLVASEGVVPLPADLFQHLHPWLPRSPYLEARLREGRFRATIQPPH